jgi:hypothetical protein
VQENLNKRGATACEEEPMDINTAAPVITGDETSSTPRSKRSGRFRPT